MIFIYGKNIHSNKVRSNNLYDKLFVKMLQIRMYTGMNLCIRVCFYIQSITKTPFRVKTCAVHEPEHSSGGGNSYTRDNLFSLGRYAWQGNKGPRWDVLARSICFPATPAYTHARWHTWDSEQIILVERNACVLLNHSKISLIYYIYM